MDLQTLIDAADRGDTGAQVLLARMHWLGMEFPQDRRIAIHWYERAAAGGSEIALHALAVIYADGDGVSTSHSAAVGLAIKGARQGFPSTILLLHDLMSRGTANATDGERVRTLLTELAAGGNSTAAMVLSLDLTQGVHGAQDPEGAMSALQTASDLDDVLAMAELARRLEHGEGTAKDEERSLSLYKQAADRGHPMAALRLHMLYSFGGLGQEPDRAKAEHYSAMANVLTQRYKTTKRV
jgi:TPR repeat protein